MIFTVNKIRNLCNLEDEKATKTVNKCIKQNIPIIYQLKNEMQEKESTTLYVAIE